MHVLPAPYAWLFEKSGLHAIPPFPFPLEQVSYLAPPLPSLCVLLLQTRMQALSISTVNYVAPSWNTSPNSTRITCPFYSLLEDRFLLERVQDLLTVHSYLRPPPTPAKSWGCVVRYGVPKTPRCSCPTQPPAFHHGNAFFFCFFDDFFFPLPILV